MSLKSVEMQIAIPRTKDMADMQHQSLQKPQQDQSLLAAQTVKTADAERQRSNKVDHSFELERDRNPHRQKQSSDDKNKRNQKDENRQDEQMQHPYKGRHIDLSL